MEIYGFGSGLLTDLYELAMAAGYIETGFHARATFELIVRSLPPRRNFLVAAGLDQALDFLENLSYTDEEIAYLRSVPVFRHISEKFFDYLRDFNFRGEVWPCPKARSFSPASRFFASPLKPPKRKSPKLVKCGKEKIKIELTKGVFKK